MLPSSGYVLVLWQQNAAGEQRKSSDKKLGEIWRTVTGRTKIGTGMGLHLMGLKTEGLKRICIIIG